MRTALSVTVKALLIILYTVVELCRGCTSGLDFVWKYGVVA